MWSISGNDLVYHKVLGSRRNLEKISLVKYLFTLSLPPMHRGLMLLCVHEMHTLQQ